MTTKPINLHSLEAFSRIRINSDLELVYLEENHSSRILQILSEDPSIRERVTVASRMNSPEAVKAQIEAYKNDKGLIRYVLLENQRPVGLISFWRDDGFWGAKNLDDYGFGFFLDPESRGKGLVTKALQQLMALAIQHLKVKQFVVFCEDDNTASISVLKKLGFEPTDLTMTEPQKGWIERKYVKTNLK